jgi:phospholipase/carboxylesterase
MIELNHYVRPPASGAEEPKQIVVLLHGYGSNGRDLITLAPYWEKALPDAVFVSPDAPFKFEISYSDGFQWFPLEEKTFDQYLTGAQAAVPILNNYLDKLLKEYKLPANKMALVGFSQGTMMSLLVGPRREQKIAGILGYSGALIGGQSLNGHNAAPICLVHGKQDSVVPVAHYHEALETLTKKGFKVTGHVSPDLGHSIDFEGIEAGAKFLGQIFK